MKASKNLYTIFFASTIVILLLNCGIGSAWTETRITTNKADQTEPSIWGNYIVWTDARNGGTDIYLQNLATKVQTRVTKGVEVGWPRVSGDKIVWQDKRNGNWDIYMYEISKKKTTRITTNKADQEGPAVYGNYIVWSDTRNGGHDIYLQNLANKVQTRISFGLDAYEPAIYGSKIVYVGDLGQIVMYDISTKKTTDIDYGISWCLSIYGNRIMYNDMFTGVHTYIYDFKAKKNIKLPFDYVENPAMYSNKVVYQDNRNGNYDIYMAQI